MSIKQTSINVSETHPLNPDLGGSGVSLVSQGVLYSPGSGGDFVATTLDLDKVLVGGSTTPVQASLVAGSGMTITRNANDFTFDAIAGSGFTQVVQRKFESSTTYIPTSGMKYCVVQIVGAGGGSSGSAQFVTSSVSGGGGAGGYAQGVLSAAQIGGGGVSVTIGFGGSGGSSGSNGGNGGTSIFGNFFYGYGGVGGDPGVGDGLIDDTKFSGGGDGGGFAGSLVTYGENGECGSCAAIITNTSSTTAIFFTNGVGGKSKLGIGGKAKKFGPYGVPQVVQNPGYGGGGAGASSYGSGNTSGFSGGNGVCIITEFI